MLRLIIVFMLGFVLGMIAVNSLYIVHIMKGEYDYVGNNEHDR